MNPNQISNSQASSSRTSITVETNNQRPTRSSSSTLSRAAEQLAAGPARNAVPHLASGQDLSVGSMSSFDILSPDSPFFNRAFIEETSVPSNTGTFGPLPPSNQFVPHHAGSIPRFVREQTRSLTLSGMDLNHSLAVYPNVHTLKLTDAPRYDDIVRVVNADLGIAKVQRFRNVKDLDLSECAGLSDRIVRALALKFPNLTSVNLGFCEQLTDKTLEVLAKYSPNLATLQLEINHQSSPFSDVGLQKLLERFPNLSLRTGGYIDETKWIE